MKLFDKVFAYTWGSAFYDSSNSYIIVDEDTAIIDPGTFKSYTNLMGLMWNDGIESVDIVLNTHLHKDHCESNEMFLRKGALLGFSEKDLSISLYNYKSDIKLGKFLCLGKLDIEIIRTPGHSPGSLTYYLQEYGAAITGDLIFENGFPGRFDLYGCNKNDLIKSLEKIRDLEPEYILPGHLRIMKGRSGIYMLLEKAIEILSRY
uniref:MBL fold metallo-hydrolase n=1 Tax=Geoglobus ahangari TaxID=113653 RepID=A0A7C3YBH7_9EURY